MNIDFNKAIHKFIPLSIIILLAYILNIILALYLPKNGIDFVGTTINSLEYRNYNGFYSKARPIIKQEVKKYVEEKNLTNYILKAIYSTSSNKGVIILEDTRNNKNHILSQNDKIDEYILSKLYKNYVIFTKNEKEFRLDIKKINNLNQSLQINQNISGINEDINVNSNGAIIKRDFLNSYVQDVRKVWENIAIEEIRTNGNIDGFKIIKIKENSVFMKLGLKDGDIIKSINNKKLRSYGDAFSVYNDINNISYLNIEILRNNEIMELTYEIN